MTALLDYDADARTRLWAARSKSITEGDGNG